MLISIMGMKTRVIEAFMRDNKLVLRCTKFYEFSHGNDDAFNKLARWFTGGAIKIHVNE